jgi:hypothetical protein
MGNFRRPDFGIQKSVRYMARSITSNASRAVRTTYGRQLAQQWRDLGTLNALDDDRKDWLHRQLVIECVNLWNHAGESLEGACPGAYGIVTLVSLSHEERAAA